MKKVVYIIGAGATQAEASHVGYKINLLMKNSDKLGDGISERILNKHKIEGKYINELIDIKEETDIEKLITLLAGTGVNRTIKYAEDLRKHYYLEILDSLNEANIMHEPELAKALLQMHNNSAFKDTEALSGIISLNHDGLFQEASQSIHCGINLGFDFISDDFDISDNAPILIQLHGSFSWRKQRQIRVVKLKQGDKYFKRMLWIPPSIVKETKDYPFNKLMGFAYELLSDCDVLRIIGCSLSQNDWNLISLIFNAQNIQYNQRKSCFKIELIMEVNSDYFLKEISYLRNVTPIEHLKDGDFSLYKNKRKKRPKESELNNPLKYWLKEKTQYHIREAELGNELIESPLKEIIGI